MPILKPLTINNKSAVYHVISSVEFYRLGTQVFWTGKFRSYPQADGATQPVAVGEIRDVPVGAFYPDPIEAFEAACLTNEDTLFYGGDYAAPGSTFGGLELEKALAWARVRTARDAYIFGGVDTALGRFDSDLNTFVGVSTAVSTMAEGSTKAMNLADHTPIVMTKLQVWDLLLDLESHRARGYDHGSAIYTLIQAAQTVEQVRSILWSVPVAP